MLTGGGIAFSFSEKIQPFSRVKKMLFDTAASAFTCQMGHRPPPLSHVKGTMVRPLHMSTDSMGHRPHVKWVGSRFQIPETIDSFADIQRTQTIDSFADIQRTQTIDSFADTHMEL
jgi:hypothetical protein